MDYSTTFTYQFRRIRSAKLAATRDHIYNIMCSLAYTICWSIAIVCFIIWCVYRIICGLSWVINRIWRTCMYIGAIIWIILIWIGNRLVHIVILLLRGGRWLGGALRRMTHTGICWALREFGEPIVYIACVYLGVLSTSMIPLALVLQLAPVARVGLVISPLATWVITVRVFDTRAYGRWQRSARTRLGVRMLRAYSDGLTWGAWLRRPKTVRRA